jgi:hypothetical protein
MTTSIELKEQMKVLKQQQREAEKVMTKMKKEYKIWKTLMNEHSSYVYVNNWKDRYDSFEALIIEQKWTNTRMAKEEFEFLFTELGFTDTDFFTTFMNWTPTMFNMPFEDRRCSICIEYYSTTKTPKKFVNCNHKVCIICYNQIRKKDGYRCCVICRESEKPK